MKQIQIIRRTAIALLMTAGFSMTASAQFGDFLKAAKQTAKDQVRYKVKNKVNGAVNDAVEGADNSVRNGVKKKKQSKKERQAAAQEQVWTFGDHTYTIRGLIEDEAAAPGKYVGTAFVTFSNVPTDIAEFQALYNEFLGITPHGTAAMIAMAMEMYARDNQVGTQAMDLLCGKTSSMGNLRILKTKLPRPGEESDDPYLQRYLPAAILKGATAQNGYAPEYPYTVEMCARPNAPQSADYTYFYILGGGWDTYWRPVTVKLMDDGHYQLKECSSVYTQCQNIKGEWPGLQ